MNKSRHTGLIFSILAFYWLLAGTGCCPSQIRYIHKEVSRDHTYIEFTENTRPLTIDSEVGGEHMTFYKVLAFQSDRFQITVTPLEGKVFSGISGDGIQIQKIPGSNVFQWTVEVDALETIFTIDLSAHPYGRYRLRIEKLQELPQVE